MLRTTVVLAAALALAGCSRRAAAPASAEDLRAGRALFEDNCMPCHGAEGRGDGPGAEVLSPKPRDLTDPGVQASLTDARITQVVKAGGKASGMSDAMPAFGGTLSDEQVRTVVVFVRTLKRR